MPWYQLDWWLVWLPSCRLCLGFGGVTECGARQPVAGWQQTRDRSANAQYGVNSRVRLIVSFTFFTFLLMLLGPRQIGILAGFFFFSHPPAPSFPVAQIGESFSVLWCGLLAGQGQQIGLGPRPELGSRPTRRHEHPPGRRDPANNISILGDRTIVFAGGRSHTSPEHEFKSACDRISKVEKQISGIARGEIRLKKQVSTLKNYQD